MTSKLTNAQISNATLIRLIRWADEHNSHYVAAALHELQERRKAAMDSEPVFFIEVEGDDWINAGRIEGKNRQDLGLLPDGINYLYAAPQPAPVVPDGWVMVPKEPTERMVIDGFESEPDETFSEPEMWEAYQKMSGCEQAAYRVRLCWAAMLTAALLEVK
ncbi:TPA: hypothetical protein ACTZF8_001361 [Raoultella ornithinolytica]